MLVAEVKTPVKKKERTPKEELKYLEGKAWEYKITPKEFNEIRAIGPCELQVLYRIKTLERWIEEHKN